jgi:predicted exporter
LNRARATSLIALFVVTALWLAVLPRVRVTTSIAYFLPELADRRAAQLLRGIAEGESARTIVLDLSGDRPDRLSETATKMMAELRGGFASVRSGLDETDASRLAALFGERSPTDLLDAEDFDDVRLTERLAQLRMRLGSPLGPLVRQLAPRDPLGGAFDALEAVSIGGLVSSEGVLFTSDQTHAFVFVVTRESAFDAPAQRACFARLREAFSRARGSSGQRLETSAVARHTVASEAQIRGDIERIGILSTVGILGLFLVLFRSLRMVVLGLVPLWIGTALALVVCHFAFGEIHGLTLAFGTSLLGVGIDYAEHYFSHYALRPEQGPGPTMRSVWPGLWMGAVTTIVGFAGLGATGFPGVRQMAVFSAVAIVGSLFATRFMIPHWMPAPYARPGVMHAAEGVARRIMEGAARRRWLMLMPGVFALALVPVLGRARFADDISLLIRLDPELVAEDTRVQRRLGPADPGRFAVVVRPDEEEALIALDKTLRALEGAKREGLVDRWVSLSPVLRARARQEASFARAKARRAAIEDAMRREGFVPEAFAPFFAELDRDAPRLLRVEDVRASPLGAALGPLMTRLPEGEAFVLPLAGVTDAKRLAEHLPDAVVLDEGALASGAYREVRKSTILVLAIGTALVVATLFARYRSPRIVAAAIVPAFLGAAGALAMLAAVGTPLNLLHVIALLLVLSMGVDFGIFVVEGHATPEARAGALVSIVTATSTTLLSFGLLGLSPNPALQALGVTITIGLTLTMALCPLGVLFTSRSG